MVAADGDVYHFGLWLAALIVVMMVPA